jgi:AcrR family transcriptional regulator
MGTCEELVSECTKMIAQDGLPAFSLRRLAERVGIKAPSIYVHFKDKDALLLEARRLAFSRLSMALVTADKGRSHRKRLIATAMGYMQFAQDEPTLFAFLFAQTQSQRFDIASPPTPDSPYTLLISRVQDFLGTGDLDVEILSFGIWSMVHGAAMLRQTHLRGVSAPYVTGIQKNLEALLDGWTNK